MLFAKTLKTYVTIYTSSYIKIGSTNYVNTYFKLSLEQNNLKIIYSVKFLSLEFFIVVRKAYEKEGRTWRYVQTHPLSIFKIKNWRLTKITHIHLYIELLNSIVIISCLRLMTVITGPGRNTKWILYNT